MSADRVEPSLNSTDKQIVELLKKGRETPSSIADQLDRHPNYIGERLKWLREWGLVRYHHRDSGLYELNDTEGSTLE